MYHIGIHSLRVLGPYFYPKALVAAAGFEEEGLGFGG